MIDADSLLSDEGRAALPGAIRGCLAAAVLGEAEALGWPELVLATHIRAHDRASWQAFAMLSSAMLLEMALIQLSSAEQDTEVAS